MSLKTRIANEDGVATKVTRGGSLHVAITPEPPETDEILSAPFATWVTLNGIYFIDGGVNDLRVNGSLASPIEAYVAARQQGDLYLTSLNILISATTLTMNRFGDINNGLTNGIIFFYESPLGRIESPVVIKTNFDLFRFSPDKAAALGSKNDAFQIANAVLLQDAYLPIIDLRQFSPSGYGVRLRQNQEDKIGISIRDDLTTLGGFNIFAGGYLRFASNGHD